MIEIMDSSRLIELVIEKHKKLLETYSFEFSEIETKFNMLRQQSDAVKKEIDSMGSRIEVLNEKYHLLFYQAKKHREDTLNELLEKMRHGKAANMQDVMRFTGRIEELEKKLQNSKHIEDEEKSIDELKILLYEIESAGKEAGIMITCKVIIDKLNDANSSHRELLSLQDKPKQHSESLSDYDRQKNDVEVRFNWLKHRIESHNNALAHWEKQRGGTTA
jgi:chromosome segregation ATPase